MHCGAHPAASSASGKAGSVRVAQSKFLQNVSLNTGKNNLNSSSVGNRMPAQVHTNHTCMSATSTKNSHNHAQHLGSPQRGMQSEVLHQYQMQRYAGGTK